jgi:hypothetical protein
MGAGSDDRGSRQPKSKKHTCVDDIVLCMWERAKNPDVFSLGIFAIPSLVKKWYV